MVDLGANRSQELLNGFFAKISGLVELCNGLINPAFIWQSLKGRCHGNQLVAKSEFSRIFFVALPFWNGLEYQNANGQLRSALNVTKLCTNSVMFSAVTPEKRLLIFVLLWKKNFTNGQIWPSISEYAWLISTNYSALIYIWMGIINLTFVLRSLKERCYGN